MAYEYAVDNLDVYKKAVELLDSTSTMAGKFLISPILMNKFSDLVTELVCAWDTWPVEAKSEALFGVRRTANTARPLIEVARRCGALEQAEAKRLEEEIDSISKMLFAMARKLGSSSKEVEKKVLEPDVENSGS